MFAEHKPVFERGISCNKNMHTDKNNHFLFLTDCGVPALLSAFFAFGVAVFNWG